MGVRAQLLEVVKPTLPKAWKIVPFQTNLDTIDTPTVMFKIKTIERLPAAPQSSHLVTFTLTVIEPKDSGEKAEDSVEDDLDKVVFALDAAPSIRRATATRVVYNDRNPAYDIEIEVVTQKEIAP